MSTGAGAPGAVIEGHASRNEPIDKAPSRRTFFHPLRLDNDVEMERQKAQSKEQAGPARGGPSFS
ncbi:MAG: hypothetical protein B1H11_00330 [Desulfobacteraceae bacterium 4484_190.1]|nr:MAG: hypothetical protein B1H11_00330 [Desulfobacteraceae bacterium 4484_190.1]